MALLTTEGNFLTANRALCDMLGYDAETLTSLTYESITHPDDVDSGARAVASMLAGEVDSLRLVKRWIRADGSILVGDLSVAVLRDELGAPIHVIAQIVDLTDRRVLEEELAAAGRELETAQANAQAVFEAVAVGLILFDAEGEVLTLNPRQQELIDLAFPSGHAGRVGQVGFVFDADQTRLLAAEELPSTRASSGDYFEDLVVWIGEDPQFRRALSMTARPVTLASGAFGGFAVASLDVTDLLRVSKAKDDFIAAISHELRTPLTATLAYLELLEGVEGLSDDVQGQIWAVQRNAWRLARLVADLIYAARATSGVPLVVPHDVDLVLLFTEALSAATAEVASKEVVVTRGMPEVLMVRADGMRLRHMIDNLLAHALASSGRQGCIGVGLSADDHEVVMTVRHDEAAVELRHVTSLTDGSPWDPDTSGRELPGGLTLSVVRMIVEAHGGEVSVQTDPGTGTTVRVALPR